MATADICLVWIANLRTVVTYRGPTVGIEILEHLTIFSVRIQRSANPPGSFRFLAGNVDVDIGILSYDPEFVNVTVGVGRGGGVGTIRFIAVYRHPFGRVGRSC
jgi:hypothetical protein